MTAGPGPRRPSVIEEFLAGLRLLGRGFGMYARSPGMLLLGLIPAGVALIVIAIGFVLLIVYVGSIASLVTWFATDWPAADRELVRVAAEAAIIIVVVLLSILSYTAVTLIIGDPFYEKISERVEQHSGGLPAVVRIPWHRTFWWNVMDSIRMLLVSVAVSVPLFACGFIPVVGQTVVPVIAAVFGGWLLAVELTGIPFNRRGLRLADRRRILRGHRALALGFGVPVYLMMLIPFVGVLVVPAAVAGSTLLTRRVLGQPG